MDKRYKDTVALLLDVAPIVFKQECFAMKGGTAINLFCRDMPRHAEAWSLELGVGS
jgi:hypothetical protein